MQFDLPTASFVSEKIEISLSFITYTDDVGVVNYDTALCTHQEKSNVLQVE